MSSRRNCDTRGPARWQRRRCALTGIPNLGPNHWAWQSASGQCQSHGRAVASRRKQCVPRQKL